MLTVTIEKGKLVKYAAKDIPHPQWHPLRRVVSLRVGLALLLTIAAW